MKSLYLTAILPPEELALQIDDIRKECAEQFNVKAALKPPVHITLFRPFLLEAERESQLLKMVSPVSYNHTPFDIELENFDTFNAHAVFIRVIKSEPLSALQHGISRIYSQHRVDPQEVKGNKAFHPHITIAYRDIPATTFPRLWTEYKNRKFKRTFRAESIMLLKHNGEKWLPFKEFGFKKEQQPSLF